MSDTQKNPVSQDDLQKTILNELAEIANNDGANDLQDFIFTALCNNEVKQSIEGNDLVNVHRLLSVVQRAQNLKIS